MPYGHAHRIRDTLAVGLLQAGVPMERVSVLPAYSSIKVTEKYYSPWVAARQEQLEADVRRSWGGARCRHRSLSELTAKATGSTTSPRLRNWPQQQPSSGKAPNLGERVLPCCLTDGQNTPKQAAHDRPSFLNFARAHRQGRPGNSATSSLLGHFGLLLLGEFHSDFSRTSCPFPPLVA